MLSNKENVLQLVALMKAHSVRHVVLCPGSRNVPLVQTMAGCGCFECYSVTDERSAGFFAVGIADAVGAPVAVCCTSGSALMNIAPAASEAFNRNVPLLIISADRPEMWVGQMDGQTMRQRDALSNVVRYGCQLPEPHDDERWYCNRLINEAMLSLRRGPVHVNVPITEPLFCFSRSQLPAERVICADEALAFSLPEAARREWEQAERPMIILGQAYAGDYPDNLSHLGAVVVSETLSNYGGESVAHADAVLSMGAKEALAPDFVITVGGHVVSKRLKQFVRERAPKHHWHVSPGGDVADTFKCLTRVVKVASYKDFFASLPQKSAEAVYHKLWREAERTVVAALDSFCDERLSSYLTVKELFSTFSESKPFALHLANSTPVRAAQMFFRNGGTVFCNRGINGIDGSLSTAAGFAAASGTTTYLVIGDLAFFYDQNGLWNKYHDGRLRILLLNNGCGHIFHHLPGLEQSEYRDEFVAAQHVTDASGIAQQNGCTYLVASTAEELVRQMELFTADEAQRTVILEVKLDVSVDEAVQREVNLMIKNELDNIKL